MLRSPYTVTKGRFETIEWYKRAGKFALVRVTSSYESPRWCVMQAALYPAGEVAFWQEVRRYLYKGCAVRAFNRVQSAKDYDHVG